MKIYKISQDVNKDYDTYDSAVVYAESEEDAREIHPNCAIMNSPDDYIQTWALPEYVKVEYLGENPYVTGTYVILASFNAG